jgi:hypothetical protein
LALASEPEPRFEEKFDPQMEDDHSLALRLAAAEAPRSRTGSTHRRTGSTALATPADNELTRQVMSLDLRRPEHEEPPAGWGWEDWSLARALQSMEIEIANEINQGIAFESEEKKASSWWRQLITFSSLICLAQVKTSR